MIRNRVVPSLLVLMAILFLYAISGCAQLGIMTDSPEQRVAAGYVTAEGVNRAATALLKAKKISSADGQHVLESTRAARQGLDVARSLAKVDPKSATAKIEAQLAILKALDQYMKEKSK